MTRAWTLALALTGLLLFPLLFGPSNLPFASNASARDLGILLDFRDQLAHGHWFPQWSVYAHRGLGGPFFGYYPPAFWYLASLMPHGLPLMRACALALVVMSLVGFWGMAVWIGSRFGRGAGIFAGSLLLVARWLSTELYTRGDYPEFAAMMLLPWVFHFLGEWLEKAGPRNFAALAVACAGMVLLHPCVAYPAYAVCLAAVFFFAVTTGGWRTALGAGAALATGAALASFYLLPLLFEIHWVAGDKAYLLIPPQSFLSTVYEFFSLREIRFNCFILGPVVPLLALASVLGLAVKRRQLSAAQKRLCLLLVLVAGASLFFMSTYSAYFWARFFVLRRMQFAYRLMSLATVSLAALGGILLFSARRATYLIAAGIVGFLILQSARFEMPTKYYFVPDNIRPENLVDFPYHPDVMFEWSALTAKPFETGPLPALQATPASCQVRDFARTPVQVALKVVAPDGCRIRLPHYYFPAGWKARLGGKAIALAYDADGLMVVNIPPRSEGQLLAAFGYTPMRRAGIALSLFALLSLAAFSLARSKHGAVVAEQRLAHELNRRKPFLKEAVVELP